MPFDIPKCLANDPDVRRMAEKVINLIINLTRPWPAFGRPGLEWIIGW